MATRGSPLAVWQAEHVGAALQAAHPDVEVQLLKMKTQGDKLLDAPLAKVGGKGLFVKELEAAMLDGRADIAVHSMKDVPVAFPSGLHLRAILERADPRDALVSRDNLTLAALPHGSVIGTSSLRRRCQLKRLRPDCEVVNLRGNVQTRLSKLESGGFDATVLALSGLQRLKMEHIVSEVLEPEQMLPAIGQGALGVECRAADQDINAMLGALIHQPSTWQTLAERAVNAEVGGGCQAPIAAFAQIDPASQQLSLEAMVFGLDGKQVLSARAQGHQDRATEIGAAAAADLIAQGARELLASVFSALEAEDAAT
jgi:hydroxymethylbilane synthase